MSAPVLTSKDNPLVRSFRLVASQLRRAPAGLVLAEGPSVLEEATASGCHLEVVLASPDFGLDPRERNLLMIWQRRDVPVRRATAAILNSLSQVVTPQGALALVRLPRRMLADVAAQPNPLVLFLCGIQDPGNLGTLLRTARAAGASWVGALAGSVSARNPKAIRASAGALFSLPVVEGVKAVEFIDYCRSRLIPLYQANPESGRSCWDCDFSGPAAIVLGNESRGVSGEAWRNIPNIRVPMAVGVESLNVAAAGAVLLFEAMRQRARTA